MLLQIQFVIVWRVILVFSEQTGLQPPDGSRASCMNPVTVRFSVSFNSSAATYACVLCQVSKGAVSVPIRDGIRSVTWRIDPCYSKVSKEITTGGLGDNPGIVFPLNT